ncbi:serine/arginine repetitive matrix protein 1-like [Physella acuta]|uniref:serine/arginine repetitive matrix protein 1-like n=1 Tax=Physella acuta TaxID=109671 RepID=UPI0027DD6A4E|nr:serine/arginine repetitive matrix protein 1-like [Physella acuta]XP_059174151.1 serine/arginine repetitive matrix protein 1-like [Physella acuta]
MSATTTATNTTPSLHRKRPLSIIEEHDSDDHSLPDKFQDHPPAKENQAPPRRSIEHSQSPTPRKDKQGKTGNQNIVASPGTDPRSGARNVSPKVDQSSPKSRPSQLKTSKPPAPPRPRSGTNSPVSPTPDGKETHSKKKKGKKSLPKQNESRSGNNSPVGAPTKTISDTSNLKTSTNSVKVTESKKKNSHSSPKNFPEPSRTIQNGGQVYLDSNHNHVLKIVGDGQGLARIRETVERLNLTSSGTPNQSSLTTVSSPKFSHRLRLSHNSRPLSEGCTLVPPSIPQITITTSGPTHHAPLIDPEQRPELAPDKQSAQTKKPLLSKYNSSKHGSSLFNRRIRNDSISSISEGELSEGGGVESADESGYIPSDLKRLQETTDKLHLSPRRPSIMLWRQKYIESPDSPRVRTNLNGDAPDELLTKDRKKRIDEALEWLRNELQEMRSQDQMLARQLLTIRQDIHQLKLKRCTEEHQDLLDDFQSELEDLHEFSYVLDLPKPLYGNNPLKHIGVTRLNLSARRFSAC